MEIVKYFDRGELGFGDLHHPVRQERPVPQNMNGPSLPAARCGTSGINQIAPNVRKRVSGITRKSIGICPEWGSLEARVKSVQEHPETRRYPQTTAPAITAPSSIIQPSHGR